MKITFFNKKRPHSTIVSRKHRRIAHFKDGKFETDNPIIIEKLKKRFKWKESPKIMSGLAVYMKLKRKAIEKGIFKKGMKKADLIEALDLEMQKETQSAGNKNPKTRV